MPQLPPLEQYEKLLAGGIAGACAKTLTAPLDRVKLLYQVDPSKAFSFGDAMRRSSKIVAETGVLSLWRGNGLAMIHVIPYGALVYMTFDNYHTFLVDTAQLSPMPARFLAGSAAGATATMVAYPLDLLRARFMAHVGRNEKYAPGIFGALSDIQKREGLGTLWRGLNPTLVGIVPYAGISFCLFETVSFAFISYLFMWQAKVSVRDFLALSTDAEIPTAIRLSAGALAGMIAQSVTYPLHVVRR
ncbi:mitochondrial carrier domain-containing protein [Pavlovales sp. CCMP2436]|nr:mitochondrial carrier domain-containing protein [Pavlovales sp. CCMP2436]